MAEKMKIRITFAVTVDPDEWNAALGDNLSRARVRSDVKAYLRGHVIGAPLLQESEAVIDFLD